MLVDANGKVYYSGMFGPGSTAADVQYRHGGTFNRFDPANDDRMRLLGTRTYGQSRLMEQQLAEKYNTVIGRAGNNYRGNRQNPLAENKRAEYEGYQAQISAGCP